LNEWRRMELNLRTQKSQTIGETRCELCGGMLNSDECVARHVAPRKLLAPDASPVRRGVIEPELDPSSLLTPNEMFERAIARRNALVHAQR